MQGPIVRLYGVVFELKYILLRDSWLADIKLN